VISQVFGYWLNQVIKMALRGFGEKVDLLSIILGLKTVVLAEPSDQYSGRSGRISWNIFLYKTQKYASQILRFLTNFEANYIPN
jgi:hypothetical protein